MFLNMRLSKSLFIKITACILVSAMLITLSACGSGGKGASDASREAEEKFGAEFANISSPNDINWLVENPAEVEEYIAGADGNRIDVEIPEPYVYFSQSEVQRASYSGFTEDDVLRNGTMVQISGLKDKETEEKINALIKERFISCMSYIPPCRGMAALAGTDENGNITQPYSRRIYTQVDGNFNNIFSMRFSVVLEYLENETGYHQFVYFVEPVNVDLNTGKEIPLQLLFCDDLDAKEYINEYIAEATFGGTAVIDTEFGFESSEIEMTSAFRGINDEQKYTVCSEGIRIFIDYENPEFATDFSYYAMNIPFGDKSAVNARFYNEEENIYESDAEPVKFLISKNKIQPYMNERQEISVGEGQFDVVFYATALKDTPEFICSKIDEYMNPDMEKVREDMETRYLEALEGATPENVYAEWRRNAYMNSMGRFMTLVFYESKGITAFTGYNSIDFLNENDTQVFTFDLDSGSEEPVEVTFEMLFKEGADYEAIVKKAIEKNVKRNLEERKEYSSESVPGFMDGTRDELDRRYIDMIYDNISEIRIEENYLYLMFEDEEGDNTLRIFEEVYGEESADYRYSFATYMQSQLFYKDLGCSNLTIF